MFDNKIPVFAICGTDAAQRLTFFSLFCKAKQPLRVCFQNEMNTTEPSVPVCLIDENATSLQAGLLISQRLQIGVFDAIWVDWSDKWPLQKLIEIMHTTELWNRCQLRSIVWCATAQEDIQRLSDGGEQINQIAQCDLLAIGDIDRRKIRQLRRRLLTYQPNLEVIPLSNRREIASVLAGKSPLEAIRFSLAIVVCILILVLLGHFHYSLPDSIAVFLGTYLQALPFLLLGILLSSAIQVFIPEDLLHRIFPKNMFGGMVFGVLGGFILPICDCASIPVFRSLVRKGVPLPAAVTFMISAPIINPVVLLSTYYAFGGNPRIMLARMGFGIVCSVLIGLLFTREKKSVFKANAAPICACCHTHTHDCNPAEHNAHDDACNHDEHEPYGLAGTATVAAAQIAHTTAEGDHIHGHSQSHNRNHRFRIRVTALVAHFREEFFEVAKYLLIGIGVSTVLQIVLGESLQSMQFDSLLIGMLAMMTLAFLLSLCSSSDAVVGKNMGASLPMGAVMAFLVFGPMMDIKNLILMSASFTKRFIVKLLLATSIISFISVYIAFMLGLGALLA
jgi:hypothetical protein